MNLYNLLLGSKTFEILNIHSPLMGLFRDNETNKSKWKNKVIKSHLVVGKPVGFNLQVWLWI